MVRAVLKPIEVDQTSLDEFAQSIAHEIYRRSYKVTGYRVDINPTQNRVSFLFTAGGLNARCSFDFEKLKAANSWQKLYEGMVEDALSHLDPKISHGPKKEPPPFVDAQGRRHYSMFAETGTLGVSLGKAR